MTRAPPICVSSSARWRGSIDIAVRAQFEREFFLVLSARDRRYPKSELPRKLDSEVSQAAISCTATRSPGAAPLWRREL